MTIDERTRHRMYLKLEQVLGPEEAATLMEHLPPVGWADVATKRDLDQLEVRLEAKLESALHAQTFRFMTFVTGLVTAVAGLAVAVARLI